MLSLGWGLRGYIGGGPLGAMIPGALVAMSLCLLLRRGDSLTAAYGAIGIGFGGQMTYGQTIGLALKPDTMVWGLTGLTLKGAIWGLLGGAMVALGLTAGRYARRDVVAAFACMVAATWAGWKLLNEPKLIYFSNRLDRPRPEIWFGLLLGALAFLAWLSWRGGARIPWRFAGVCALGGGFGFGLGGSIQIWGPMLDPKPYLGYWKCMELFFGFCFGVALGWCAWRHRDSLAGAEPEPGTRPASSLLAAAAIVMGGLYLAGHIPSRFGYTILGAVLMAVALYFRPAAWHIAITMTYGAYSIDFLRARPAPDQTALWAGVALTTLAVGWCVARRGQTLWLLLLLLWTAVGNSMLKSFAPPADPGVQAWFMEALFALMAAASTWMALRAAR